VEGDAFLKSAGNPSIAGMSGKLLLRPPVRGFPVGSLREHGLQAEHGIDLVAGHNSDRSERFLGKQNLSQATGRVVALNRLGQGLSKEMTEL